MRRRLSSHHGLILFALIVSGIELFIGYWLWQQGWIGHLLQVDVSRVSLLILLIYVLATLWFLGIAYHTSQRYLDLAQPGQAASPLIRGFFQDMTRVDEQEKRLSLLEVLDNRLRSGYAFGFIVADMMLKLGLLGTVIGFIFMLGSLNDLNSIDITVMQSLLAEMSSGMKVALYTTLVGMLSGILLNLKFNLLDWSVDHLLNDIREIISRDPIQP